MKCCGQINIPQEAPWLTYRQFGNLAGNLADMIVEEQNRYHLLITNRKMLIYIVDVADKGQNANIGCVTYHRVFSILKSEILKEV